jgi:hypothetical protein
MLNRVGNVDAGSGDWQSAEATVSCNPKTLQCRTLRTDSSLSLASRYRSSLVVYKHTCVLFGGHDGSRHLNDVHVFNFGTPQSCERVRR